MKRFLHAVVSTSLFFLLPLLAKAQPTADFSANITQACSPIVVQFTDMSTGSPTSWFWNLGNGATSTLQNPSTTYITPGTYTVTLTASNAGGSNTKTTAGYITVLPSPTVQFAASDSSVGCPPRTVSFTNLSTPNVTGGVTYSWDFGDGTTSTAINPTHTYTQQGSFAVTLVVTNSSGCTKVLSKPNYIQMTAKPTAGFTATNTGSCFAPLVTSFSNTSVGATSYQWNFGDGATSTQASPTHTYNAAGSYTVRLIATSAAGCSDTLTIPSFVSIGNLDASFTQSATMACVGAPVTFTNTSTPGPGTSTWYFGDGTQATGVNATRAYTAPGTYTVKLVVNYSNCVDSALSTVTVQPKPTAAFTGAPLFSCTPPLATTFSNTSSNATSYLWLFGDGTTSTAANPTKTYNSTGTYTVRLVAIGANGCADTLTRSAYVRIGTPAGAITANPSNGCAPATLSFQAASGTSIPVTSYSWNFGDGGTGTGQSLPHTYTAGGTYTVVVTFTLNTGCTYTAQTTVQIGAKPNAAFTGAPTTICAGQSVTFTNGTTGATSYAWSIGGGTVSTATNPTIGFNQPGIYTVTLLASNNGCHDTEVVTNMITVNGPLADFSFTRSCTDRKTLQFTSTSTATSGSSTYAWNFGDGNTSTVQNPSHTYASLGTYTVTLAVTDLITGCTSTKSTTVYVVDLEASFTADDTTICKGQAVLFSSPSGPYYSNHEWNFGDGGGGYGGSIAHTYTQSGIYTVRLIVGEIGGCADTLIKPLHIQVSGPTVAFGGTPVSGCAPLSVVFTDSSTIGAGQPIVNRSWTFGDGQTLVTTGTSNTHVYPLGIHTVTLVATDAAGCKDSVVKPAYISVTKPTAAFTAPDTTLCVGMSITFSNTSSGASTYNWDFGDGTTATAAAPVKSWNAPGTYTVRLIATNAAGCNDTLTRTAYVNVSTLIPSFTASDTFASCPPLTVQFTNTSAGTVLSQWTLGNGSFSSQQNPSTVYTLPGTYTVKLKVTNTGGCIDSVTKTIVILGPSGSFTYTPQSGCAPIAITFNGTAQNATSFTWDMNNGQTTTTTAPNYTHTFTTPGYYVPIMVLSNGAGCNVAYQGGDTIKVSRATAGFIPSTTSLCNAGTVSFTDTSSTTAGTTITGRTWDFGNGQTSTAQNPSVYYGTPGTYTVLQTVTNSMGCTATATRTITILPKPNGQVSGGATVCSGGTVPLLATGGQSYAWSPATGLSCTTCANPTATVNATQTYTVITTGANGCHDTDQVTTTMYPQPVISVTGPQTICSGTGAATLAATGAATYVWSPSTGLSSATGSTVTASPPTTTTYLVTGTSVNGCSANGQTTVIVDPSPVLVTNGPVQNVCNGATVTLTASGATTYSWSPAAGLSCTTCPNPVASPLSTTTYTVTGTTGGCSTTSQITVNVTSTPAVSAGPDQNICVGGGASLQAGGATTYVWSPATDLSCTSCANPTATPTATTTYTVVGTAPGGCVGTDQVTVTIVAPPTVSGGPSPLICAGASTPLQATGATDYSWSPATGLSCNTCANPVASPGTTTVYTVTGTTFSGCVASDTVTVNVAPLPVLTVSAPQGICPGSSAQLSASGADTLVWSPAVGLSCTACANPTSTPSSTIVYTVSGTSAAGCVATPVTTTVTVNPLPTITAAAVGGTTICEGDSITLTGSGGVSYVWSPVTGVNNPNNASVTVSPTQTTIYTVTGIDVNGCQNTAQITVNVTPLPNVSILPPQPICAGASISLQAFGATGYSWTPSATLSSGSIANPTATPSTTTTYVVTGTAQGCSDTAQVMVLVNPVPNVTVGSAASICPGASVTLSASGAASYGWSPAASLSSPTGASVTATPATTTTYTVTGTDANGCTDTGNVTITVFPAANISAGPDAGVCNGQAASLLASGGVSYVWSPATDLSCTTCANPQATPTSSTTYTLTGTDANGCVGSDQVVVNIGQLPTIYAGIDTALCAGSSVNLGATGGATYVWTPSAGLSATTGATVTASPTATTTYVVTGTNAQGCSNNDTVVVTVRNLPAVTVSAPTSICPGLSTTLGASGAVSYAWNPAATLSSATGATVIATPVATTTYTVTGTDAVGCANTAQVLVTVFPAASISAGPDAGVCNGQAASLQASGGVSYAWSPATDLSCTTCANPQATPTTSTTYTVTGTDANGCVGSDQVVVNIGQLPTISAGADTAFCAGSSVNLTATGGATYVWTPSTGLNNATIANPTASGTATTTYVVTGTNAQGCSSSDTVVVIVKALPIVDAGTAAAICPGFSTNLSASGAVSYAWSPAATLSNATIANPTATPTSTTTYTVTGTGANGCTATDAVTVTVYPAAVVGAGADQAVCAGQSATLTGTGAATYSWSPATGLSNAAISNPVATPTVTTTYTLTGTTVNGCVGTDDVTVTVNALPTVSAGADTAVCAGLFASLQATGATTYSWSPATGLNNASIANPTASPAATTTYTVTGTSATGCVGTDQVTVTVRSLPAVNAGADKAYCAGGSAILSASGASTYAWGPAAGLSCTGCMNPTANPTTTTTYTLTGTDGFGCVNTDVVTVTVNPLPNVNASADIAICERTSTTLTASGASSYIWTPGSTLSCTACASTQASPMTATTYTVTGTDANGCVASDAVTVSIVPHVPTQVGAGDSVCQGGSVVLTASGGVSYQWSPGTGLDITNGATVIASPDQTTTYTVFIQENQCYWDTARVTVGIHPVPTVNAGADQSILSGEEAKIFATSTDATIWKWTPSENLSCGDCLTPTAKPVRTQNYMVEASNQWGCSATDEITINVGCDLSQLFIPNTFTPNGDGQNDRFYPRGKGIGKVNRFRIYNRWGELVYELKDAPVNDLTIGWDGMHRGIPVKPDVYVWMIEAQCESGDPLQLKGDISLLR